MREDAEKINKLLEIIRDEILPVTENEAARKCGITGGAIIRPDTLTSVMTGSDSSVDNGPLFRGEIDALSRFFKLPVRPDPAELIFVATHGPCAMGASAIAAAGFREVWRLYTLRESEERFGDSIGTALGRELFGAEEARAENGFYKLQELRIPDASPETEELLAEIDRRYDAVAAASRPAAVEQQ